MFDKRRVPLILVRQHAFLALSMCGSNQLELGKRDSSLRRGPRADPLPHEVRIRRGLLPLAARLEIPERMRLQRELIESLPVLISKSALNHHHVPFRHNTKRTARLFLLALLFWIERLEERVAKPYVSQPRLVQLDQQCQMIELWRRTSILASDPRRQQTDAIPKCPQQRSKSTIQLVAKPTATQIDDLVKEPRLFAANLPS